MLPHADFADIDFDKKDSDCPENISTARQDAATWRLAMFGKSEFRGKITRMRWVLFVAAIFVMLYLPSASASSNVPAAVISSSTAVNVTGLESDEAYVALDACGNLYTVVSYGTTAGGTVYETPVGGGAATQVLAGAGPNYNPDSLWIDSTKSNLYVTQGSNDSAAVIKIPIVNCVPQTSSKTTFTIGNLGAISYYYSTSAVATDTAGDVFIATDVACCAKPNELLEESPDNKTGTTLLGDMTNPIVSMTVDSSNNIYYVDSAGTSVYELAYSGGSYAAAPEVLTSGYTDATGVSMDSSGNLYVADKGASAIYEVPNEGSGAVEALNASDQYLVATGLSISSNPAPDVFGNLYYTDDGTSISELTRAGENLGSVAVGSSGTTALGVVFNAALTPTFSTASSGGAFTVGSGGTCVSGTAYTSGGSCTVSVQFAPTVAGGSRGLLLLSDASGKALATTELSGTGTGAALTLDPGALNSLGSGYSSPMGMAVDASGDTFVADSGANEVWEVPTGGGTPVAIGTGLKGPEGVAVDAAGDLYIADTGNNRIVMVPVVSGKLESADQQVVVANGASLAGAALSGPTGLTVDLQGNLYIADTGNNRVVLLPGASASNLLSAVNVGSGWSSPLATTVTAGGLIYVADSGNGNVYSLVYPTGTKTLVATGFSNPSALATDAAGDLFVVDQGNGKVLRIPMVSGSLSMASASNVSAGIGDPYGLAMDSDGNLFVSDNVKALVYSIYRTSASQTFGKWSPNSTSSVQSYSLENAGNGSLTLGTPYYTATGDTADFAESSAGTSPCAAGGVLAAGTSCSLSATFTPLAYGNYAETLALSSNATNGTAEQATFTGTGAVVASTTTTLSIQSPTGVPYYGEPITLSVSVASTDGTPIGTVALLVDGNQTDTATLSNGTATFKLGSGLAGGSHTLQAMFQGGGTAFVTFGQSSSAVQTLLVSKVSTTTTLAFTTLYSDPASQPGCAAGSGSCSTGLTLTASVTPSESGIPTGSVTFVITQSNGTTIKQSAPLATSSSGAFEATYVYNPVAPAASAGNYTVTIVAEYSGDGNFSASQSAASTPFSVSPATGDVTVTQSGTSITTGTTGSGTISFAPASYGGWTGLIGFTCDASTLPANARCVFSPGQTQITASTPTTPAPIAPTTMSVTVNQPPLTPTASGFAWWIAAPAGFLLLFARRRYASRLATTLTIAGVLVLGGLVASGLSACGSSAQFVTPTGTSTVTVVAYEQPFQAGSTSLTQACPAAPGAKPGPGGVTPGDPALAPCAEQTFKVAVTVQ